MYLYMHIHKFCRCRFRKSPSQKIAFLSLSKPYPICLRCVFLSCLLHSGLCTYTYPEKYHQRRGRQQKKQTHQGSLCIYIYIYYHPKTMHCKDEKKSLKITIPITASRSEGRNPWSEAAAAFRSSTHKQRASESGEALKLHTWHKEPEKKMGWDEAPRFSWDFPEKNGLKFTWTYVSFQKEVGSFGRRKKEKYIEVHL